MATQDLNFISASKSFQQGLCLLQIRGIESFREPVVDLREKLAGLLGATCLLEQAAQAYGRPQLPRFRLLPASPSMAWQKQASTPKRAITPSPVNWLTVPS